MKSIAIPEPSLSSRAMLCSLSIAVWSARKHDPEASEEIAHRHGAQTDAGRYHKVLLPKEALAEIQKIVSEARNEHYFMTLPWDDNGYRVLPAAAYMDHTAKMRELSNQFAPAVEALAQQFGQLVEQAKVRLGGLFRSEDYPGPDDLRSKFSFETKVMPLPDAGDFRVALGDEEKERIKRQITSAVEASLQIASRDLWLRLYEAVSHLAERLHAYKVTEEGVEHPFRDSVVTNLVKLVDVLPKLNVTGDPELERLAAQVRASLLVDPQELRKSESVRTETAKTAAAIATRMAGYMAGYSVPSGLYLPSVERRGLGEIVIAVDTSGSIGYRELEQFAGEISAISEETQPEAIYVVYCDAAVQSAQEFRGSEPVRLEPKGGGGTDFRPAFEWVAKNDIAAFCLIYLTDLCCDSFGACSPGQ